MKYPIIHYCQFNFQITNYQLIKYTLFYFFINFFFQYLLSIFIIKSHAINTPFVFCTTTGTSYPFLCFAKSGHNTNTVKNYAFRGCAYYLFFYRPNCIFLSFSHSARVSANTGWSIMSSSSRGTMDDSGSIVSAVNHPYSLQKSHHHFCSFAFLNTGRNMESEV